MDWKQLKMTSEDEDRWALQTLTDNGTITKEQQKTSWQVFDAIVMTIKSEDQFWHFQAELLLAVHQHPTEGIHPLNTQITTLINNKFPHKETNETLKIMVQQQAVRHYEAWDWIWLKDQSQLTYRAYLNHWQLLESQLLAVPEGQGEGLGKPHLPLSYHFFSVLHPWECPHAPP